MAFEDHSTKATMVERGEQRGADVNIEDADVLVAGGRGLGNAEGFELCESLADALGGAVAATRAVVDAGWYPYAAQIGQTASWSRRSSTWRQVSPARSSTSRHAVVGEHRRRSTRTRTRQSSSSPDLGIVGDLNKIMPKLTEAVKAKKKLSGPMSSAPIEFPPPVDSAKEFVGTPTDPEDERIEVGVAIVGGGPAGLACAIRLTQLLAEDEALMESLGEVPVALVEKGEARGRTCCRGR